jgi:hypothetical protein
MIKLGLAYLQFIKKETINFSSYLIQFNYTNQIKNNLIPIKGSTQRKKILSSSKYFQQVLAIS